MQLISAPLWVLLICAQTSLRRSVLKLASEIKKVSPEELARFANPEQKGRDLRRSSLRYIRTEQFAVLKNPEITRIGQRTKRYHTCLWLLIMVLICYYLFLVLFEIK